MNDLTPLASAGNPCSRARLLARHGYAVLPVQTDKRPFDNAGVAAAIGVPMPLDRQGGAKLATRDGDAINRLWAAFPGAMIGVATGALSGGLIVLDVDQKNGRDGFQTLAALGHRPLPHTAWQKTRSGGHHYLFRGPAGRHLPNDAGQLGEGLDRRGDGGYIVDYGDFNPATSLANAPEWLITGGHAPGRRYPLGESSLAAPSLEAAIKALNSHDPNDLDRARWIAITSQFKQSIASLVHEGVARHIWDGWCGRYDHNDLNENNTQWRSIKETSFGWRTLRDGSPARPELMFGSEFERHVHQKKEDTIIGNSQYSAETVSIITREYALENFTFVSDGSAVIHRKDKSVRKLNDARNEYSGSFYVIASGKFDNNGKPIIKSIPVIDAWLKNNERKTVDVATWSPGDPELCHPPEKTLAGNKAYNLWTPPQLLQAPANWEKWVKPFHDHVSYLIPIETERQRFMQWLAHIFQYPGVLPHTCYLMIANTTGIGRNTLASILTRALRGYVAANMDINALFGGFNGRISQKLLATVDEVREGNSAQRYEKQEAFKSKITEETRALNPKYGLQSVEKNCCRWLMFSNHLDALPFDNGDRRIIVIKNPDLRHDAQWFVYLRQLIADYRFIASVQKYLFTLDLSDFNAFEIAPMNAAKQAALFSMESAADAAARQFATVWPGDLGTVRDLRDFLGADWPSNQSALRHVLERAGMRTAGRLRVRGSYETVLVVRGALLVPADVAKRREACVKMITNAQSAFQRDG